MMGSRNSGVVDTGDQIGKPMRHDRTVRAVTFNRDGTRVLTGSDDSTARLWDAATGGPIGEPIRHEDAVKAVAFSRDGNYCSDTMVDARLHSS
jgi:WD40 repeat protein